MSWIKTIEYEEAEGRLKKLYQRVKGRGNKIDNVLKIHSLRPHTLSGHMTLYKSVLHNSNNTLPKWYLEALGVYVSYLNRCDYCVKHHFVGFKRLIDEEKKASLFWKAVQEDDPKVYFDEKFTRGMTYARKLTLSHDEISKKDITELVAAGFSEGEVLEINQLASYFNYVNRMVVGLGVTTDGDEIGLSPGDSDNPNDWSHH